MPGRGPARRMALSRPCRKRLSGPGALVKGAGPAGFMGPALRRSVHQIARSQRHAVRLSSRISPFGVIGLTAGADAAGRERDIGGDDDTARHSAARRSSHRPCRVPHRRMIKAICGSRGTPMRPIGNQINLRTMARSHAVAFVLHRAGIGIDEEGRAARFAHKPGLKGVAKRPRASMQSSVSGGLMKIVLAAEQGVEAALLPWPRHLRDQDRRSGYPHHAAHRY